MNNKLAVLCVMQNKLGQESRYRNYEIFKKHIWDSGLSWGNLYTAEIAFEDNPYKLADAELLLRTNSEIWQREAAFNLLLSRLYPGIEYVVWTDPDQTFTNPNWIEDTIDLLQRYPVIQMFSHSQDLDAQYKPVGEMVRSYVSIEGSNIYGGPWAIRRSVLEEIGGFPDWNITASADRGITCGFFGYLGYETGFCVSYYDKWFQWRVKAYDVIKGNVGFLPGLILHYWHGDRKNRMYDEGLDILTKNQFNPNRDICKDEQGLYQFTGNNPVLERDVHLYMESLHRRMNEKETV